MPLSSRAMDLFPYARLSEGFPLLSPRQSERNHPEPPWNQGGSAEIYVILLESAVLSGKMAPQEGADFRALAFVNNRAPRRDSTYGW